MSALFRVGAVAQNDDGLNGGHRHYREHLDNPSLNPPRSGIDIDRPRDYAESPNIF